MKAQIVVCTAYAALMFWLGLSALQALCVFSILLSGCIASTAIRAWGERR